MRACVDGSVTLMSRLRSGIAALLLLAACGHEANSGTSAPPALPPPPPPPATCLPAGLEGAGTIPPLVLPPGCSFTLGGASATPLVITNAAELGPHLECTGVAPPAIDLTANDLYVVTHWLSPAYGGSETRDDGAVVTFVTRFRPNCPDDPMPMPISSSFGFLLPKGAARTFREANCSLPSRC